MKCGLYKEPNTTRGWVTGQQKELYLFWYIKGKDLKAYIWGPEDQHWYHLPRVKMSGDTPKCLTPSNRLEFLLLTGCAFEEPK